MKSSHLKGALLEYIVRNLFKNCGFTNVKADNIYSFESSGLFFVNGKGAAHDADIIMNPPIQMPFSYPTQLIFECKAYESSASLPIVRNALGLRNDLNDFEIVTKDSLKKRRNNRRASYAIETRARFQFQVGVASINDFTKPAIEFASNNKIPLLSLSWFLSERVIADINKINQKLLENFDPGEIKNVYDFFKNRSGNLDDPEYQHALTFLRSDNIIGDVVTFANTVIKYFYVGLLETGDMVYLFARSTMENNILNKSSRATGLKAKFYWLAKRPNVWTLTISDNSIDIQSTDFEFFIPTRIYDYWKQFNLNVIKALDIKQEFFSKIFVFNHKNNPQFPFSIITLDSEWLEGERQRL